MSDSKRPPTQIDWRLGAPARRRLRIPAAIVTIAALAASLITATALPATAATTRTVVVGDFESTAEGWAPRFVAPATGTFALSADDARTGSSSGKITLNPVATGSASVQLTRSVNLDATSASFSVKSTDLTRLTFRVVDSDGQTFQQDFDLSPTAAGWQDKTVASFTSGLNFAAFGGTVGAGDKVWRGPAKSVTFIGQYSRLVDRTKTSTLLIDNVGLVTTVADVELALTPVAVGNVFDAGADVQVEISSTLPEVSWTARDVYGAIVATGSSSTAALSGRLHLQIDDPGYYDLVVTGQRPDGTVVSAATDLAVLEPVDISGTDAARIGIASHYGNDEAWNQASIPLVAKAGLGHVRDETLWRYGETTKGTFSWPARITNYTNALAANGLDHFNILAFGNPLYPMVGDLVTAEGRDAFANYALNSVDTFRRPGADGADRTIYEVWNEWNLGGRFIACPTDQAATRAAECTSAANYYQVLSRVWDKVKPQHPDAEIVAGGQAGYNGGWFTDLFNAGGYDKLDAISFHPYVYPGPAEQIVGYIDDANRRMREYAGAGNEKPIIFSEHGWATGTASDATDEMSQADNLVRAIAISLTKGVERYTIYELMDGAVDLSLREDNFGIIRNEADPRGAFVPKPGYVSVATLTRALLDRDPVSLDRIDGAGYRAVFSGDTAGESLNVMWSPVPMQAEITTTTPLTVTDLVGRERVYTPTGGVVQLSLGASPIYVQGVVDSVTAGGVFSLTGQSTVVGDDTTVQFGVDNRGGSAPLTVSVALEGTTTEITTPAGTQSSTPITVPGRAKVGSADYVAVVTQAGDAVARVSTRLSVGAPSAISATHALTESGDHVLRIRVTNNARAAGTTIASVGWNIAGSQGTALEGATLAPLETVVHDVPIANPTASTTYTATARVGGSTLTASGRLNTLPEAVAAVTERTVDIDGIVDPAVAALPPIDLMNDATAPTAKWTGPEDQSGKVWYTWDDDNVYVTAQIVDDVHAQNYTGGSIWNGDGLQLTLAAGTPGEASKWSELGLALTSSGVNDWRWSSADGATGPIDAAQSAVVRDEAAKTTTYELAVPWQRLAPLSSSDRLLSTALVVNDDDGTGRSNGTWFAWGNGITGAKDSAQFKAARLDPAVPYLGFSSTLATRCVSGKVYLYTSIRNDDTVPLNLSVTTPLGNKSYTAVAPGRWASFALNSRASTLAAGTVTVVAASGATEITREAAYGAKSCG